LHQEYYDDEMEIATEQVREKERREFLAEEQQQGAAATAAADFNEWWNQTPPTSEENEQCHHHHQIRGAFGGCYDECYPDGQDHDIRQALEAREHGPSRRYGMWEEDCFSMNDDDGSDASSYDSSYCAEFGYYPREYNYEREIREAEEAAAAEAAVAAAEAEAAAAEEAEAAAAEAMEIEDEAEHTCEVAQMKLGSDHPDVQHLEDIELVEPKERFTASSAGGMLSAQKKAAAGAAAKAAKARQAKQQQKKQQQKFVPLQVTDNTNHINEVTAILTASKLEINLPKKKLLNATREAKKRHVAIWRRIETSEKHTKARGTRIANIPEPRSWHNCGGSDNEY
jgi:hypothetical protein